MKKAAGKIDGELKFIKAEITDLKHILSRKADVERLHDVEKRVKKLEEKWASSRN